MKIFCILKSWSWMLIITREVVVMLGSNYGWVVATNPKSVLTANFHFRLFGLFWVFSPRQCPRFSIKMIIWIFCSDTLWWLCVFLLVQQSSFQIVRRQCCLVLACQLILVLLLAPTRQSLWIGIIKIWETTANCDGWIWSGSQKGQVCHIGKLTFITCSKIQTIDNCNYNQEQWQG